MIIHNANEDYHNGAAVREVCLDAEDIVIPNLNASTVRIIQVQIPNLKGDQWKWFKTTLSIAIDWIIWEINGMYIRKQVAPCLEKTHWEW